MNEEDRRFLLEITKINSGSPGCLGMAAETVKNMPLAEVEQLKTCQKKCVRS